MNFKQHRNYGVTVAALLTFSYFIVFISIYYFHFGVISITLELLITCIASFFVIFAGSLAPDLDTDSIPSKWVSKFLALWWACVIFAEYTTYYKYELQWKPAAIFTLIFLIAKGSKHRGMTHSLIWVPALLIFSIYTGNHFTGAFAVGLATHYYCDGINMFEIKKWFGR